MIIKNFSMTFDEVVSVLADINYNGLWPHILSGSDREWTVDELKSKFKYDTDRVCIEEQWAADLFSGSVITVIDTYEDSDDPSAIHDVSLDNFNKAARILANKHPEVFARFMDETYDIEDEDMLFQLAVFGEIIY